ncbi:MAG: MFS transporter [Bacteroidia bacterium]|nr:MFS transporter [Bacteroidia bacterium]
MQKTNSSFVTLITVFFFWGFVGASNGILIPLFKEKFLLTQFQSQLVDLAFYMSYAVGSLIYFFTSRATGDPIDKIGYKKALILGLLISSIGALLFIPAANLLSYPLLLAALFVIGLGFALQQIVANPFVINFGAKETGSHRLNLAGGLNSFGTTIGPVILSYALFGNISGPVVASNGLSAVKIPALILFGLFILCATILWFSKLPTVNSSEKLDKDLGALKYPQLTLGMVAIFVYVGVEVTIQSNLGALLQMPEIKGIDHTKISHFISLYWGSLMIGRWTGALTVFNFSKTTKLMMQIITPFLAFAVIYGINYLRGSQVDDYLYYIPYICIASVLFIFSGDNPARTLLVLSLTACLMMIIGLVSTGNLALYSFISGGLFCSVMWPCIFALAINGLGKYTNQGSSLLVMMILGGAIIPPLQGILVDLLNPQISYIVTVFCFAYLAWYAFKVKSIFKKQGIEFQSHTTVNH